MLKKHKQILVVIIVLILAGIGYVLFAKNGQQNDQELSTNQSTQSETQNQSGTDSATPEESTEQPKSAEPVTTESKGIFSDEYDITNVDIQVFEVSYSGGQFLPNSLEIKVGDIVVFKNDSPGDFWPASGPHPTHTAYPEFDAKSAIASGKTFDFKFLKAGSWKFHNHLNPEATGTIVVTK